MILQVLNSDAKIRQAILKAKESNINILVYVQETLENALSFYHLCLSYKIKPILAQKIPFGNEYIIVYCKDFEAYKILCRHSLKLQNWDNTETALPFTKEECSHFLCKTNSPNFEYANNFGDDLLDNTTEIADKISYIFPEKYFSFDDIKKRMVENLPVTTLPVHIKTESEYLQVLVRDGAKTRYGDNPSEKVKSRISFELDNIISHHLERFFLFFYELTSWCRNNNIAYGVGAFAPSSIVNYILRITDVEPIENGLLYERFINQKGEITIIIYYDFQRVPEIVQHLKNKYGEECVAQNKRKSIYNSHYYIFSQKPIYEYLPVCKMNNVLTCQYSLTDLTYVGLVKTKIEDSKIICLIDAVEKSIQKKYDKNFNIHQIPLDDELTMNLFRNGDTESIFYFDSQYLRIFLKEFEPDCFLDIVALSTLYRPGLDKLIPDLIKGKAKRNICFIKGFEDILKDTYGVIVYQEQVILIIQRITGCSLFEATTIFLDIRKNKKEKLMENKKDFIISGKNNGYSETELYQIFETITFFSGSIMNKAHFVASTKLTFQSAYLKAHYPKDYTEAYNRILKFE